MSDSSAQAQVDGFFAEVGAAIDGPDGLPTDGSESEPAGPEVFATEAATAEPVDIPRVFGEDKSDSEIRQGIVEARKPGSPPPAKAESPPDPDAPFVEGVRQLGLDDPAATVAYLEAVAPPAAAREPLLGTPEELAAMLALAERARLQDQVIAQQQEVNDELYRASVARDEADVAISRYDEGELSGEELATELAYGDPEALSTFLAHWQQLDEPGAQEWVGNYVAFLGAQQQQYQYDVAVAQQVAKQQEAQQRHDEAMGRLLADVEFAGSFLSKLPPQTQEGIGRLIETTGPEVIAAVTANHGLQTTLEVLQGGAEEHVRAQADADIQNAVLHGTNYVDEFGRRHVNQLHTPPGAPVIQPVVNLGRAFPIRPTNDGIRDSVVAKSPMVEAMEGLHAARRQAQLEREKLLKAAGR